MEFFCSISHNPKHRATAPQPTSSAIALAALHISEILACAAGRLPARRQEKPFSPSAIFGLPHGAGVRSVSVRSRQERERRGRSRNHRCVSGFSARLHQGAVNHTPRTKREKWREDGKKTLAVEVDEARRCGAILYPNNHLSLIFAFCDDGFDHEARV